MPTPQRGHLPGPTVEILSPQLHPHNANNRRDIDGLAIGDGRRRRKRNGAERSLWPSGGAAGRGSCPAY